MSSLQRSISRRILVKGLNKRQARRKRFEIREKRKSEVIRWKNGKILKAMKGYI